MVAILVAACFVFAHTTQLYLRITPQPVIEYYQTSIIANRVSVDASSVCTMGKSDESNKEVKQQQAEDEFETVSHEDAETPANTDAQNSKSDDLSLIRFDNDLRDVEDDSDEDEGMAHHPLFNMLAGRLGQRRRGSSHKYDKYHPENQVLTIANVNDCVEVEDAAFPPEERASREKVIGTCCAV